MCMHCSNIKGLYYCCKYSTGPWVISRVYKEKRHATDLTLHATACEQKLKLAVEKYTVVYPVCGFSFCSHVRLTVSCMPSLFLWKLEDNVMPSYMSNNIRTFHGVLQLFRHGSLESWVKTQVVSLEKCGVFLAKT